MRVLLVYPRYPDTFWSLRQALKVISKKAAFPPLGLLTVGAMLPREWEKKLVDMNVTSLTDRDIRWADYVFISAMVAQRESSREVIARCKKLNARIVAGGPLFTSEPEEFPDVDHLVLNEAEITLPPFLEDLARGTPRRIYTSEERPDVRTTPVPAWHLLEMKKYATMSVQYSRGCPFDCEFCDIVVLNGRKVRTKSANQFVGELEALYDQGWRGGIFVVDDNFIGSKKALTEEVLPAVIGWQQRRKYPFVLATQASVNLSDDENLMHLMTTAGFDCVFIGIETPNQDSLEECNKRQNKGRDLVAAVQNIQEHGLQVQAGFILGFDSDTDSIFKSQIDFVRESGIVVAMVGLLNVPRGTRLHHRLKKENRLLETVSFSGDNTDCTMNFIPRMDRRKLVSGYKDVLTAIYSPAQYYRRIEMFLKHYRPRRNKGVTRLEFQHVLVLLRSIWFLGVADRGRWQFWRFFTSILMRQPRSFPISVNLAVWGFHFQKLARKYAAVPVEDVPEAPHLIPGK